MINMRNRFSLLVLIIPVFFLIGALGNIIIMNNMEEFSEGNTTEFMATVVHVNVNAPATTERDILYTEEYTDKINLLNIRKFIDMKDFAYIQPGQIIFFRVDNVLLDQFDKIKSINIVSLRTEEKEIVSLSRYNEAGERELFFVTVAGSIIIAISILSIIVIIARAISHRRMTRLESNELHLTK